MSFIHLPNLAFLNLGPWEIALILFLALLLFGGKKLPGLAKDLGQGIREFRRSISASSEEDINSYPQRTEPNEVESYHSGASVNEESMTGSKKRQATKKSSSAGKKKKV